MAAGESAHLAGCRAVIQDNSVPDYAYSWQAFGNGHRQVILVQINWWCWLHLRGKCLRQLHVWSQHCIIRGNRCFWTCCIHISMKWGQREGASAFRVAPQWELLGVHHISAGCERNMGLRQKLEAEEGFPYSSRLWQGKWVVLSISHIYTITLWSVMSCFFFFIFFPVFKLSLSFLSSLTDFDCDFHLGLEAWSSLPNCTALASAHFHCLCACCFWLVSAFLWCFWRAAASRLTNYAI